MSVDLRAEESGTHVRRSAFAEVSPDFFPVGDRKTQNLPNIKVWVYAVLNKSPLFDPTEVIIQRGLWIGVYRA